MEYVKFRTSLRHNRLFKRLSDRAQKVFCMALLLTGEHNADGALTTRVGPFTDEELAEELLVKPRDLKAVMAELSAFIERGDDGIYRIAKWDEKAGEGSTLSGAAERMRRLRARRKQEREERERFQNGDGVTHRNEVTRTGGATNVTDKRDQSKELLPYASLREDAREESDVTRDADVLADYLLDTAIHQGLEMGHYALDRSVWRYRNRDEAQKLIAAYGLDLCKVRAMALVSAITSGKLTARSVSTGLLFRCWTFRELADVANEAADVPDNVRAALSELPGADRGAA